MTNLPYQNWTVPTIRFCEDNLNYFITQPANTWSNLAFIFAALYLFTVVSKSKNLLLNIFPFIILLIGISSFFYHASFTFAEQLIDLSSMFLLSSYLIVFNLYRINKKMFNIALLIIIYLLIVAISTFLVFTFKTIGGFNIGIPIFALQIIIALGFEYYLRKKSGVKYNINYLLWSILLAVLSQIIWWMDYLRIWCNPKTFHFINGHVLWHLISAIVLILIFNFYRQFQKEG